MIFVAIWQYDYMRPRLRNIYFHKLVGRLIFLQAWIHATMHLLNFGEESAHSVISQLDIAGLNVSPDPVKFLQLSWSCLPGSGRLASGEQEHRPHLELGLNREKLSISFFIGITELQPGELGGVE